MLELFIKLSLSFRYYIIVWVIFVVDLKNLCIYNKKITSGTIVHLIYVNVLLVFGGFVFLVGRELLFFVYCILDQVYLALN